MLRRHGAARRWRRSRSGAASPISFSLSFRSFFSPPPLFSARAFLSFSLPVLDRSNGIIISWRVWFPSVSDSFVARPRRRSAPANARQESQDTRARLHYWFPKWLKQPKATAPPPPSISGEQVRGECVLDEAGRQADRQAGRQADHLSIHYH